MIAIDRGALAIGGKRVPLLCGAVHYWRVEREAWPVVLDRVVEMGLRYVESYVPWAVHEMRPGSFDFGRYDPRKDLGAFLDLVHERGLYFLARPGPHINAELTYFGYPRRLFEDPDLWSISSTGSPVAVAAPPRFFPALSYANDRLYEEYAPFLDAACAVLVPRQYPDGPLVAVQVDNEMSGFFRTAAYDHDYSAHARAEYTRFLERKYGTPAALSAAYRRAYGSFDEVPMPRSFEAEDRDDLPHYLDWMEYKEESLVRPLFRLAAMFRERGLSRLLTFHNFPSGRLQSPFHVGLAERGLDIAGLDSYQARADARGMREKFQHLAAQSRFPFVPELGAGCMLWWKPLCLEDHIFSTLYALMLGVRGMSFYMAVERERWYGSPIGRRGEVRPERFGFYRVLSRILAETDLAGMERVVQVAVCRVRDYDRLEKATSLLSPLPPLVLESFLTPEHTCDERTFGFAHCIQIEHDRQLRVWSALLDRARVPFDRTDTGADPALLARYRLLLAPTFEFCSTQAQEALLAYARGGGTLVIGPLVPEMDEGMREHAVLGEFTKRPVDKLHAAPDALAFEVGRGQIVLLTAPLPSPVPEEETWPVQVLQTLLALARVEVPFAPEDSEVQTTLFRSATREILMIANPTPTPRVADLPHEGAVKLEDLFTGEVLRAVDRFRVTLPPFTVRMLEVKR